MTGVQTCALPICPTNVQPRFFRSLDSATEAAEVGMAFATSCVMRGGRLAAWASIFAVCTAFAGIWGMNFETMPELKWRYGYPVALALIVATCAILYWRFKRARWL